MTRPNQTWPPAYRPDLGAYSVAFSFAGEQCELVRQIAEKVEAALLPGEVFFDEYFEEKLLGTESRTFLTDIYLFRCTLVVRCLSQDYKVKIWPQFESTVIDLREPESIVDLQMTEGDVNGWVGQRAFCVRADLDPQKAVDLILTRLRGRLNSGRRNRSEVRLRVNVFECRELVKTLETVELVPGQLRIAVFTASMKWPAPDEEAYDDLVWWLNIARVYETNVHLIDMLRGLWSKLAPFEGKIKQWFQTYCGELFAAPQAVQSTPVIQITRELWKGRKDSPKSRVFFDVCQGSARTQISVIEADDSELASQFAARFDDAQSRIDSTELRVELVLELDQLHGAMQRQEVRYGDEADVLHLIHPTVIRHLNRKDFHACCEQNWHAQAAQNIGFGCFSMPPPHRWEQTLEPKNAVIFFSIEAALQARPKFFKELVMARAPIAIWFSGAPISGWTPPTDAAITQMLTARARLPKALRNLRNELKQSFPDVDITLLYEDPTVPVRSKSEFTQEELSSPT